MNIKFLCDESKVEGQALDQAYGAAKLPPVKNVVVLPDVHTGYALPIGTVACVEGYVWPGAVGYDIGCGMCHVDTGIMAVELEGMWNDIYNEILERVPVGPNGHAVPQDVELNLSIAEENSEIAQFIQKKATEQLGTLGGGNHFIEIGVSESRGTIGVTIHSGSRKPGHAIADYYMRLAKNYDYEMFPLDSYHGQGYMYDKEQAENFALMNRKTMMRRVLKAMGVDQTLEPINENHNDATPCPKNPSEIIHRKGATPAHKGQPGIIPANQGQGTYITSGLGNEEYECCASHGAGRRMSRKKAKKELDLGRFQDQMNGIVCKTSQSVLDEAPDAYKDITEVLAWQDGVVVDVVDHYMPVLVVKA